MTLKTDWVCLLERSQFVAQKLEIKFQKWKRFEEKAYCILSSTKYGQTFFMKKLCIGKETFWDNFFRMFYMETNDQIMQGWKLMVKMFQRSIQVSCFPY